MLKKILLVIAIVLVGIIIASRFQPASYTVERSATIEAPPEVVFQHVNDFAKWQQFNVWGDADPNAVYTYSDVSSGVGANFHWKGNSEMGEGRMTILESKPNEYVKVDLEFIEPFAGKAIVEYVITPEGTSSKLTHSMSSEHNFFSRIMCMFMDMDKMIGEKSEEGMRRMNKVLPALVPATEPSTEVTAVGPIAQ